MKNINHGTYCNYFRLSNKLKVNRQANSVANWLTRYSWYLQNRIYSRFADVLFANLLGRFAAAVVPFVKGRCHLNFDLFLRVFLLKRKKIANQRSNPDLSYSNLSLSSLHYPTDPPKFEKI